MAPLITNEMYKGIRMSVPLPEIFVITGILHISRALNKQIVMPLVTIPLLLLAAAVPYYKKSTAAIVPGPLCSQCTSWPLCAIEVRLFHSISRKTS